MATSVPKPLVPFRFRLARAKDSTVLTTLIGLSFLLFAVEAFLYPWIVGQTPPLTPIGLVAYFLKIIGIVGDELAVGVLFFSLIVKSYSKQDYIKNFSKRARKIYEKVPEDILIVILKDFHGVLKSTTSKVLESDVGAALLAGGTILMLIAAFLKS